MSEAATEYFKYICLSGDTFDLIALAAYSEETMSSEIIRANPNYSDVLIFEGGEVIRLPVLTTVKTPDSVPPWRR